MTAHPEIERIYLGLARERSRRLRADIWYMILAVAVGVVVYFVTPAVYLCTTPYVHLCTTPAIMVSR
jgi:hypothetical protein